MKKLLLVLMFGVAYGDVAECVKPTHEELLCDSGKHGIYMSGCFINGDYKNPQYRSLLIDRKMLKKMKSISNAMVLIQYDRVLYNFKCTEETPMLVVTAMKGSRL